jgi:hypothetical protein
LVEPAGRAASGDSTGICHRRGNAGIYNDGGEILLKVREGRRNQKVNTV